MFSDDFGSSGLLGRVIEQWFCVREPRKIKTGNSGLTPPPKLPHKVILKYLGSVPLTYDQMWVHSLLSIFGDSGCILAVIYTRWEYCKEWPLSQTRSFETFWTPANIRQKKRKSVRYSFSFLKGFFGTETSFFVQFLRAPTPPTAAICGVTLPSPARPGAVP